MKTGLTLEQLAAEITRQQNAKEDYVVNTGNLRLESYGHDLALHVLNSDGADRIEPLEIGDIAHRQIGTHLSIPAKYYERMRSEDPGLLAHNVNTWLERTPAQRMIRVLDGKARAYLSNRYLRMDNYSIASAVLPILAEIPDVRIESCQITDSRMYKDGTATRETNPWYGQPIPAYRRGYTLFANSHLPEKITVFGVGQRTQDIYNADILRDILAKTVITRTFEEVTGKDIKRIHQEPIPFSAEEKAVWVQAVKEFHTMRQKYFTSTNNARKDAMLRIIQQITLLLRISAAPNTVSEYSGELPGKLRRTIQLTGSWAEEIVAIGVRHTVVLDAYAAALREAFPNRPLFIVTGATTTFAKRRALRQTLRESGNGILLCTQQSLPSSVNFEFVNKVIIPELHYNNSRMSQFYMRFIRFNSVDWKDIYFLTYAQSIESNLMQMILAKEKLNLFMKGDEADMDDIYERFGVDYDLTSLLLYRDIDEDGRFSIRWGEQEIA